MDENRFVDYFVVAGLPPPELGLTSSPTNDLYHTKKVDEQKAPVVDVVVINKSLGEVPPPGYECIERTHTGLSANLNHGSMRAPEMYLCFRRGYNQRPVTDIGVLNDSKEHAKADSTVIRTTPYQHSANVNNSSITGENIFITYRLAEANADCNTLTVVDICVIIASKGERCPHTFCQIPKNLNKGMFGADVYLCYKKSSSKLVIGTQKPVILGRYPAVDHPGFALSNEVAMFCLPMGAAIECWPAGSCHPLPIFLTFVLTNDTGVKMYAAAIICNEDYDEALLTDEQTIAFESVKKLMNERNDVDGIGDSAISTPTLHQNRSICFLSRWPFFDAMRALLLYIYRLSVSGPQPVPVERYIGYYLTEVPFPTPQRPKIFIQLDIKTVILTQPEETQLPRSGASFIKMLLDLGPENSINLLLYALLEHKILMHSLRPNIPTFIAEALTAMMFPFRWLCPYIPLCPLALADVLESPTPFIVGMDSRYFDICNPPSDVTLVDLDTSNITVADDRRNIASNLFPKKPTKALRATLERIMDRIEYEFSILDILEDKNSLSLEGFGAPKTSYFETAIQEAFVHFMATLLKGYANYLLPITAMPNERTTDVKSLFNVDGFLRSVDRSSQKFYSLLVKTQSFCYFIMERSFGAEKTGAGGSVNMGDLSFFDECIAKLEANVDGLRLLEYDETLVPSPRTMIVMLPQRVDLPPGVTYEFKGFDKLQSEFFLPPAEQATPHDFRSCSKSRQLQGFLLKRTKQEAKLSPSLIMTCANDPDRWAKCVVWYAFTTWFMHLLSYMQTSRSKRHDRLVEALAVLDYMHKLKLPVFDEMCYRVLMHVCGRYNEPALAVRVYAEMKRQGITPNAVTYGVYNKVMLESRWPTQKTKALNLWRRLRHVVSAATAFRSGCSERSTDKAASDLGYGSLKPDGDSVNSQPIESTVTALEQHATADEAATAGESVTMRPKSNVVSGDANDVTLNRTSIVLQDVVDSATWQQIMAYHDSNRASVAMTTSTVDPDKLEEKSTAIDKDEKTDAETSTVKSSTAASRRLVRRQLNDGDVNDPLGALTSSTDDSPTKSNNQTAVGAIENDSSRRRLVVDAHELEKTGRFLSDQNIAAFDRNSLSTSRSAEQLDDGPRPERSRTVTGTRLEQLKQDGSTESGSQVQRRSSFSGMMRSAKTLMSARYRGLRNTLKAASADWLNVPDGHGSGEGQLGKAADDTDSAPQSRASSISNLDQPVLPDDDLKSLDTPLDGALKFSFATPATDASEIAMRVEMCTASKCEKCGCLLYDDQIMAGWLIEESSYKTCCTYCSGQFSAFISIEVFDFRHVRDPPAGLGQSHSSDNLLNVSHSNASLSALGSGQKGDAGASLCGSNSQLAVDEKEAASVVGARRQLDFSTEAATETRLLETDIDELPAAPAQNPYESPVCIRVPYLSPFVLRKEMEILLDQYGLDLLNSSQFLDVHSVIYWNLVWYFKRLGIPSHIEGYVLTASSTNRRISPPLGWRGADRRHVSIHSLWDSVHTHADFGQPMFYQWRYGSSPMKAVHCDWPMFSRSAMQQMVSSIMCVDVTTPIQRVLAQRQRLNRNRQSKKQIVHRSAYREILFLAFEVLNQTNIDIESYDTCFKDALDSLPGHVLKFMPESDRLPDDFTACCRKAFPSQLEL